MRLLLKAIRDALIANVTLTATVPAADITSSYIAETANFPCITMAIDKGGSVFEITGVTRATLEIEIHSNTNKQQLWKIYEQIKALLHDQERNLTTFDRIIHLIYELDVDDTKFNSISQTWILTAKYEILYGTSGLEIITASSGAIYAHATAVTAVSGKEIAKFRGMISLDVSFEREIQSESERFGKEVFFRAGRAIITIGQVMFKADSMDLLWDISKNPTDTLADGSTAATSYTVNQSTVPSNLQVLFQCVKTGDGNKLEVQANNVVCEQLQIPFSTRDLSIYRCRFLCLGDSDGNVIKVTTEN